MNLITRLTSLIVLVLITTTAVHAQTVSRGPYLQMQTSDSITVHWRTTSATDSVVRYGVSAGNLNQSKVVSGSRTEHSVQLTGLSSAQQYFYSVGSSSATLAGDSSYHFFTAPPAGIPADTRIWVIGDSGTANADAINVYNAFRTWSAADPADFWLMLGDNAYNSGTDAEYQAAVFNTYPEFLRQLPLWATLGNHDAGSASSATQSGVYYDIFEFPKNAEVGGWPSGTEAYYSFDYANIHFVCLNSQDVPRAANGAMMQWLEMDLMDNATAPDGKPWVIAFWHHPPYTKGSHNSDTEPQLIDMRQIALPILESWGVDLVLTGHSHSYERSYLLDGHYGISTTLDPVDNILDPGDGNDGPGGDGAYEKPDLVAAQNAGAVYAVAGSSGKISSSGSLNHPAMYISLLSLGSMVLDVSGNRMDVTFLNQSGAVLDEFTLQKTPDSDSPLITGANAPDSTHVLVDFDESLNSTEAVDAANYSIAGLSISQAELLAGDRTVRLTTSAMSNGSAYTLLVNNLKDISGNTILPGSSVNFQFHELMTLSFQDGIAPSPAYAGTRDGYIRQETPTTVYGLAATLQVDGDDPPGTGNDMNILLGWDISAIPIDAVVETAHLELEVTNLSTGVYNCYSLLRDWQEDQATWNQAANGTNWNTAGAAGASDRGSEQLCTVSAGSTGPLTVNFTAAGLGQLQSWVNSPGSNYGLIISNPTTTDGADFHSRDSTTPMARPKLVVTYRVPVVPTNNDPVASYLYSCNHLACDFTDTSTDSDGSIVAWSWNFGDGATSSAQDASHTFSAGGDYTVSLTVTDDQAATDLFSSVVTVSGPIAPTAGFSHSCTDLSCDFTDTSGDSDGVITNWLWNFGDGDTSTAQNPSHSFATEDTYTVSLTVTDDDGLTDFTSDFVTVSAPPAWVDQLAQADLPSAGTVNGSYLDTHADGGAVQSVTERESGGKKNQRHSYLSHTWQFSVTPGSPVTLYANAWSGGSVDGDSFRFAWSSDNSNFSTLFTVTSTDPANMESSVIPASGTLYIRVTDTDQTSGNNNLDTVFIDQLYIRSQTGTPPSPPAAPDNLQTANPTSNSLDLSWQHPQTDETGFDLERAPGSSGPWAQVASPAGGSTSHVDSGLASETTYYYRIRARNSAGASAWSNTASGTTGSTPPPPAIALSASGYKIRGVHIVDLSWSGAGGALVTIERDGSEIHTTASSAYTDNTGNKGARTYVYKVCLAADPGTCSNVATVVF